MWGGVASHPVHHVDVLLRVAEVPGQIRDAERLELAAVHPSLVLGRTGNPVKEDAEGLPDGFLAN